MTTERPPRWPTPAETARTLVSGVVPATLLLSGDRSSPFQFAPAPSGANGSVVKVRPFVNAGTGELLVLADDRTEAAQALGKQVTESVHLDTPALLDLLDVPPVRTDLPRARVCAAGWVEALTHDQQRTATVQVAATRPASELLNVGHTATLYRFHPAELSLTRSEATYDVDLDEFRSADPDPVYESEHEITGHLQHHHYDDLTEWALARLDQPDKRTLRQVTITGIDRYGLDLACVTARGCARPRVTFATPVADEEALGDALRELSRCPCEMPGAHG